MTGTFTEAQYNNILLSYHPDCGDGEVCSACGSTKSSARACSKRPSFLCMELWRAAMRSDHNATGVNVPEAIAFGDSHLLDAAARRLFAIERNWLPMDTAPRDGTPVLLLCQKFAGEISRPFSEEEYPHSVEVGLYSTGRADYPGDNWWDLGGDGYATWGWPTYWQPLPPPPPEGWPLAVKEDSK